VLTWPASALMQVQLLCNCDLDFLGGSMRESLAVHLPKDINRLNMNRIWLTFSAVPSCMYVVHHEGTVTFASALLAGLPFSNQGRTNQYACI